MRRRGVKPVSRVRVQTWEAKGRALSRVEVEDLLDRAPADGAERNVVAREHDAVGLRTIEAARFVVRPLERTDLAGVRAFVQQRGVALLLVAKQRIHLGFRPVRRANVTALLLNLLCVSLELVLGPRRRNARARSDEI